MSALIIRSMRASSQPPLWSFARALLLILVCALPSCATRQSIPAPRQSAPAKTFALQATSSDFDVLTQHDDSARTGANLSETQLTPDSVTQGQFQRLFHWDVDGQIYGQPLYVSHVAVGARTINLLIVTTMNNSVYAFEAPPAGSYAQPSKTPVWHIGKRALGSPLPYDFLLMDWGILGYNIKPQIGIVSTPVIDRGNNTVYVTAKSGTAGFFGIGRHVRYRLLAIDLPTGKVIQSVAIKARVTGPNGAVAQFDATHQMQRAGLLEANGRIYLAFASHQDSKPYHGWLLAYHAVNRNEARNQWLKPMESYCTTCGRPQLNSCDDDASCEGGSGSQAADPPSIAAGMFT
jgi:hypothetical protein